NQAVVCAVYAPECAGGVAPVGPVCVARRAKPARAARVPPPSLRSTQALARSSGFLQARGRNLQASFSAPVLTSTRERFSGGRSMRGNRFRPPRWWQWVQRSRLRMAADAQLLSGAAADSLPLLAWRASQLTSDRNRRILARSLRGVLSELDGHVLPGASPLNRAATRPHSDLIETLADRLEEVARPVSARGILLVEVLLTDGSGPLYARDPAGEIGEALERCL